MRWHRSVLVWTAPALGSLLMSACMPAAEREAVVEPPTLSVRDAVQSFGRADQGSEVSRSFTLRNTGGLDLTVDNVRAPCGCAAAPSARAIAPGGEATIDVKCDTTAVFGDVSRTVTVYTNDPRHPVTSLTLSGSVALEAAADPPELYVGRVRRGEEVPGGVRLVTRDASSPGLGPADAAGPVLDVALENAAAGKRLRLTVRHDAPLGAFAQRVAVHTTSARVPVVEIPVTGTVVGDLAVSPRQLRFGSVSASAGAVRVLGLRNEGRAPVRLTSVSMSPPLGTADVQTLREGQEYRVVVALPPGAPLGRVQGEVELHTDHPEQHVVAVPFTARVVAR
jgi:hypothetical protein